MILFAPPTPLVLYSKLPPDECVRRLYEASDPLEVSLLSFSSYRGNKNFLSEFDGHQFEIRERIYSRNVQVVFAGKFVSIPQGTRVAGAFDFTVGTKTQLGFAVGIGAFLLPILSYDSARDAVGSSAAIALMCMAEVVLMVIPRILRAFGLGQERNIADFLVEKLEAGEDPTAFN